MRPPRLASGRRRRQRGVYAIVFALMLMPLILLGGMAIDLSMAYMRRTDLQTVADGAALAAARALDGTEAGAASAVLRAASVVNASRLALNGAMAWSPAALRFSDTPDGAWLPVAAVNAANAPSLRYARIDSAGLAPAYGAVRAVFAGAIDSSFSTLRVEVRAVAGRNAVQITPLAICALDAQAASMRANTAGFEEFVEHGFRRGVSYNLLDLNPVGANPLHYQVNPIDFPPAIENVAHRGLATLRPMVCSGNLALPFLPSGARIYVSEGFPASLTSELNSRFGSASGSSCDTIAAPADINVKEYTVPAFWMRMPAATPNLAVIPPSAARLVAGNQRKTIAEASGATPATDPVSYGPLWTFAKPRRYVAATPGTPGAVFPASAWPQLYPVASTEKVGLVGSYPADPLMPYRALGAFRQMPSPSSYPKVSGRRILNIPLLACPVDSGGTATVLAVGSFLMTSRATVSPQLGVYAEFGGLAKADALGASVVLYR
ncbi:pilus assembly protein TadE [Massilia atriviolacea]|uniref:Pilus assembly protein TadE n=1 Tax=Massilia atriviolacea TaxID=2495579 RepID=A0A430HPD6_9BURK|nr:pilus assembly protein TadG-related protein [Massilia atriviolacea]RSZ59375.1 pilus assembly protein TadE [Massilia atriviolacea]